MSLKIFHTVNAGLYFHNIENGLLVDGLHLGDGGFSVTPKALTDQILSHTGIFSKKIDLAFTHLHGDHYDPRLVRRFFDRNPDSSIYAPDLSVACDSTRNLASGIDRLHFGSFSLTTFPTIHDGALFADQPHRSFCLQTEGRQYVICGDAILHSSLAKQMLAFCSDKTVAVFLNVYQLASDSGLAFLKLMKPEHIFLYHLPFPDEDPYNYRTMAKSTIARQSLLLEQPIRLLDPLSHITF